MKNVRLTLFCSVLLFLMLAAGAALGETARVITPGGALNMRKKADEKSNLMESVPNKSLVEVEEVGDTWCKITYKRKTGYVKTEYLKLPSQLPGKTVYSDGDTLLLRAQPDASAPIVAPVSSQTPVEVREVQGEWALVSAGDYEGWTETASFSYQLEAPEGEWAWIPEQAAVQKECAVRKESAQNAETLKTLSIGQTVQVTVIEKDDCLILTDGVCGYVSKDALCLIGPEDSGERMGSLAPIEAFSKAEAALKKKFKNYAKESLYSMIRPEDGLYRCGFFNDQDQYVYGALVDAEDGGVLFMADYHGFAAPAKEETLLPVGEMTLALSAETLAIGDVMDISVQAWENCKITYRITKNGTIAAETEPGGHFSAAYRPRQAGEYLLTVTASDEAGHSVSREAAFTVDGSLPVNEGLADIYSQKDGWWKDKKYRHSNLGKSGCAIFALSHALSRMGFTEDAALPENLAVKYAYCLIPNEGTSNELLINTAARDFGFQTKKQLINDAKQIAQLIRDGAFFSFSIARGHIAMVSGISEDGSMVRVVDSAPLATFERIVNAAPYYQLRSGAFRAALSLDDLPGARWYLETDEYGGLEYYLPMEYVAKRGVRLIQPITNGDK